MLATEHRAAYVRAVAFGLVVAALTVPLGLWAERLRIGPGFVPVYDPEGRSYWLVGLAFIALVGVAAQWLDRDARYALATAGARGVRYEAASELPTAWIFPACLTFGVVALLEIYHSTVAVGAVALLAFGGIAVGMVLHHHLFDPSGPARQRARALYTILVHGVAFLALSMVYVNKVRSLFSATAVLVIGLLLLLQLTDGEDVLFARRLVYALVGGLMLGQVTWVLNYWEAVGWTGGAALLVVFYFAAGLIATQLHRGVGARDVLEYGVIAALALGIVVYSILA